MPLIHPAYLARERQRVMRPDAHRFIRPDWRRYVQPGFELAAYYERIERKYRPDQARVPAGSREGGQWTDGGGGSGRSGASRDETTEISAAARKGGEGHHYVPGAEVRNRGVSPEAAKVFEEAKTGPLLDTRSNKWDKDHRVYNEAVGEALDAFLKDQGSAPEKMTAEQAREFLRRIYESADPRIRSYNYGIQIREIMQPLLRRGGRE